MAFWYFSPHGLAQEKTSFVLCGHTLNPSTGLAIWQVALHAEWSQGVDASGPAHHHHGKNKPAPQRAARRPSQLQEAHPQRAGRAEVLQRNLSSSREQGSGATKVRPQSPARCSDTTAAFQGVTHERPQALQSALLSRHAGETLSLECLHSAIR